MGTRSCIARLTTSKAGDGFKGVYHHWDGYPDGLGATLFALYNGHFKRDAKAMLKYLIDDHPAGWSSINGADFTQAPGYNENGFKSDGPACYCHGGRHESAQVVTHRNASDCGCEYAYVFSLDGKTMSVLSSVYKSADPKKAGKKMIGMFGYGAKSSDVYWKVIGVVKLDGKEPNWGAMR